MIQEQKEVFVRGFYSPKTSASLWEDEHILCARGYDGYSRLFVEKNLLFQSVLDNLSFPKTDTCHCLQRS